jgi:transcription initiation factor TFIIIB Brf1 subunit/transcription initiation factor TFIIB
MFETDDRLAQTACKECGTVVRERLLSDKEWVRNFEGEVNSSFHGPPSDPRYVF